MAGLTRLSGVSRSYSHIRLHVRRRQRGNHRLRNPRFPRLPTSLIFSRAEVKWGNQVPSCPWPDTGGAAWLAFGPCRNSWLRARHRRKYLQFPQPPPNSSLLHRCQDISSLHLPHGVQKNDTPNRPGGCIGCFHLGPIPPWLACPVALPRRTATFLLHAPPVGDHLDSSLDWSRQGISAQNLDIRKQPGQQEQGATVEKGLETVAQRQACFGSLHPTSALLAQATSHHHV